MHNSKTSFNTLDLDQWHTKIRRELKGRAIDELIWKVNPRIQMQPMLGAADRLSYSVQSPSSWAFAEKINVFDAKSGNEELLSALKQGIEAPFLILHAAIDLDILLKGVQLKYIQLQLEDRSEGQQNSDITKRHVAVLSRQPSSNSTWRLAESTWQNQYDADLQLAHLFTELTDLVGPIPDQQIKDVLKNLTIDIEVGTSFYLSVAKVKATRILYDQWLRAINISNDQLPAVTVGLSTHDWTTDIHHNLILSTTQCLSAILGGAHQVYIPASDTTNGERGDRYRRMARNIHQLLALESKLQNWDDPIKGSYYIETLSYKIAESAWQIMQQKVADKG